MALTSDAAAQAEETALQARQPGFSILRNQLHVFLEDHCTRFPDALSTFVIGQPLYGRPRARKTYAVACGDLEMQFRVLDRSSTGQRGAVLEVIGYDWRP
jgi:hypothetical protein